MGVKNGTLEEGLIHDSDIETRNNIILQRAQKMVQDW